MRIGDVVGVKGSARCGEVLRIDGEGNALVRFRKPVKVQECSVCGSRSLFEDCETGEIECVSGGCGHRHGFETWEETVVYAQIVEISEQQRNKAMQVLIAELKRMLGAACEQGVITSKQVRAVLQVLGVD